MYLDAYAWPIVAMHESYCQPTTLVTKWEATKEGQQSTRCRLSSSPCTLSQASTGAMYHVQRPRLAVHAGCGHLHMTKHATTQACRQRLQVEPCPTMLCADNTPTRCFSSYNRTGSSHVRTTAYIHSPSLLCPALDASHSTPQHRSLQGHPTEYTLLGTTLVPVHCMQVALPPNQSQPLTDPNTRLLQIPVSLGPRPQPHNCPPAATAQAAGQQPQQQLRECMQHWWSSSTKQSPHYRLNCQHYFCCRHPASSADATPRTAALPPTAATAATVTCCIKPMQQVLRGSYGFLCEH